MYNLLNWCATLPLSSDAFLERVATEKRMSLIKAWEESEKAKAENRLVLTLFQIMKCSYYSLRSYTYRANGSQITSWATSHKVQLVLLTSALQFHPGYLNHKKIFSSPIAQAKPFKVGDLFFFRSKQGLITTGAINSPRWLYLCPFRFRL